MEKGDVKILKVQRIAMHQHTDEVHFCMVLQGEMKYNEEFVESHMVPGDFNYINMNPFHCLEAVKEPCVIAQITFKLDWLRQFFPYAGYTLLICDVIQDARKPGQGKNEHEQELWDMLLDLVRNYFITGELDEERAVQIYSYLNKYFTVMDFAFNESNPLWESKMDLYLEIYKLIVENYRRSDCLSFINSKFYYSQDYLNRVFRSFVGSSLQEWINNYRCWASEPYLIMTDDSIIDVAAQCGFSDSKYYYKYFRKWYGMTPAEFRVKWQENRSHPDKFEIFSTEDALRFLKENDVSRLDKFSAPESAIGDNLFIRVSDVERISGPTKSFISAVKDGKTLGQTIVLIIQVRNGTIDGWKEWHDRLNNKLDSTDFQFIVSTDHLADWHKRVTEMKSAFSDWENLHVGSLI